MHIVVCVKRIIDPGLPRSWLRVDESKNQVGLVVDSPLVINPFDEQAVEAALRIRESSKDPSEVTITVLTLGEAAAEKVVRHTLALGADAGVMLIDPALHSADGYATAHALAAAIVKLGEVDLVLAGRQAADLDAGVVGLGMAELLGFSPVTLAKRIAIEDGHARVERAVGAGGETVLTPLPAVITIAHEFGGVRKPNLRETMRAGKKRIDKWSLADIGVGPDTVAPRLTSVQFYEPDSTVICEWITGDTPAEMAQNLLRRMREERIL